MWGTRGRARSSPAGPDHRFTAPPATPSPGWTGRYGSLPASPTPPPPGPQGLRDGSPHGCSSVLLQPPQASTLGYIPQSGAQDVHPTQPAVGVHVGGAGHTQYPRDHPVVAPSHGHPGAVAALTPRGPGRLIDPQPLGWREPGASPDPPPTTTGRRVHRQHPVPTRSTPSLPPVSARG